MMINWAIGGKNEIEACKLHPIVFSIQEEEIHIILDWVRNHECHYSCDNSAREALKGYSNEEIIDNGLVSMLFEQYASEGSQGEPILQLIIMPSLMGTRYKIQCKCGEELEPALGRWAKNIWDCTVRNANLKRC